MARMLFLTPRSPYARKARILLAEKDRYPSPSLLGSGLAPPSTAASWAILCLAAIARPAVRIPRNRNLAIVSSLEIWTCIHPVVGMYPSDIASSLDLAPSTVSHHLRVLEEAGLVRHVQQGRHRLYLWTGERWGVVSEAEVEAMMVEQQVERADQVPT